MNRSVNIAIRAARAVTALLFAAVVPLLAGALPARADDVTSLVIEDTAGALYLPQLRPAIAKISFYQPTKVVIFTRAGSRSDDLNEEVLRFARSRHPEWITADGQKWADGLFVFALDTTGRHVGTYFGEDRKIPLDEQTAIQEDTKSLFREAQWTDGTIEGVRSAASRIARPWYLSPATLWTGGIVGGGALVGGGIWAGVRANNRRKFAEAFDAGDRAYASVTLQLQETELNASTIPDTSAYGSRVLERWHTLEEQLRDTTMLRDKLAAMTPKERSVSAAVSDASRFREQAETLDGLDDAIADSNALLNLNSSWREGWRRQSEALVGELSEVEQMLNGNPTGAGLESAAALRAHAAGALQRLSGLEAGLDDRSVTPDAALDAIKAEREQMADLLQRHADAVIAATTRSEREADLMREKIDAASASRPDTRRYNGSIVDIAFPRVPIISVINFGSGLDAGQQAVDSARSAASSSSSSSSTGYGSSGGSFSGSGSSSSF
ncbi:putative membrane protein YgcG [Arthrobacter woluwensis]|uniref:DUF5129 domain-containing protein n=1 Tax=Arthrobacter woluwensis TaxID=156980 RepID=UPI0027879DAD|nr:DUF5129 domain-containing protein [Arthrobacter woluwensis]MDQ0707850.1 putative membrane protein YgcG [Arthrobacter woluwensis]